MRKRASDKFHCIKIKEIEIVKKNKKYFLIKTLCFATIICDAFELISDFYALSNDNTVTEGNKLPINNQ